MRPLQIAIEPAIEIRAVVDRPVQGVVGEQQQLVWPKLGWLFVRPSSLASSVFSMLRSFLGAEPGFWQTWPSRLGRVCLA